MTYYPITVREYYMIYISAITQKGQATIPANIRKKLDLHTGDKIGFEVVKGRVVLKKVAPFDYEHHRALANTLSEWDSAEDDEAYNDL